MENRLQDPEQLNPEIIASILIPLATRSLLVPTVAVAEIVPYHKPRPIGESPDWLLGEFSWRDQRVPLMSLELLCGEQAPELHGGSKVAVFNNTGISDDLPFVAIASAGIPKLVQVSTEDLSVSQVDARPFESLRVVLHGEEAVIPDISSLEQVWLEWNGKRDA